MTNEQFNQRVSCPKCGYDGGKGYFGHQKQLNQNNPNNWICGSCSEAFK